MTVAAPYYDDQDDPLGRYRDLYRDLFAANTAALFETFRLESGVDAEANRKLVEEIVRQERELGESRKRRNRFRFAMGFSLGLAGLLLFLLVLLFLDESLPPNEKIAWVGSTLVLMTTFLLLSLRFFKPRLVRFEAVVEELKKEVVAAKQKGLEQLKPLHRLIEWDLFAKLVEMTVPHFGIDPLTSEERVKEMRDHFGWNDSSENPNVSTLYSESGQVNGNPFLMVEQRVMKWVQKRYTGSKTIRWTTRERDSNGKYQTVHHSQTLTASVEKPAPHYSAVRKLLYGNDAAPNLSFSRKPTELAHLDKKKWTAQLKRDLKMKKLEKHASNLDDESQYTLMGNREFELLFNATNRDNEREFRLLFTPLATRQMVELLTDREVGYGDNFRMIKRKKINTIIADHLTNSDFDCDPQKMVHYSFAQTEALFNSRYNELFKLLYLSLAPLLTIPAYRHVRTAKSIYGSDQQLVAAAIERETVANSYGDTPFAHSKSATQQILKTAVLSRSEGATTVEVTAHGYRTEKRVDHQNVWGRDGRNHIVPVAWLEYLPVEQRRKLVMGESAGLRMSDYLDGRSEVSAPFAKLQKLSSKKGQFPRFRRSILSYLP